jgi:uncharacterized protein YxeA
MRSLYFPLLTVLIILFAGFFLFSDAAAGENTCMFKADSNKVHITVWDEDSGQDRQDKIFEGWLESGEEKKIQRPVLLFSAIKKPKMIDLMAITTKPVKAATSFGYRRVLYGPLGCIESGHLS